MKETVGRNESRGSGPPGTDHVAVENRLIRVSKVAAFYPNCQLAAIGRVKRGDRKRYGCTAGEDCITLD